MLTNQSKRNSAVNPFFIISKHTHTVFKSIIKSACFPFLPFHMSAAAAAADPSIPPFYSASTTVSFLFLSLHRLTALINRSHALPSIVQLNLDSLTLTLSLSPYPLKTRLLSTASTATTATTTITMHGRHWQQSKQWPKCMAVLHRHTFPLCLTLQHFSLSHSSSSSSCQHWCSYCWHWNWTIKSTRKEHQQWMETIQQQQRASSFTATCSFSLNFSFLPVFNLMRALHFFWCCVQCCCALLLISHCDTVVCFLRYFLRVVSEWLCLCLCNLTKLTIICAKITLVFQGKIDCFKNYFKYKM